MFNSCFDMLMLGDYNALINPLIGYQKKEGEGIKNPIVTSVMTYSDT